MMSSSPVVKVPVIVGPTVIKGLLSLCICVCIYVNQFRNSVVKKQYYLSFVPIGID